MLKMMIKKFEYGSADLLLDSIEDFLKGPQIIEKSDGEQLLGEKRKQNEKLQPLATNEKIKIAGIEEVFLDEPRKAADKLFFHLTGNGHYCSPNFLYKKSGSAITAAYGFSIQSQKISRIREYYAVDPFSESYVKRTLDKKRGRAILKRCKKLEKQYKKKYSRIEQSYREAQKTFISEPFWREYLGMEK